MNHVGKLKILHILSQRPDSTGSGIYLQAMLREAVAAGHTNFLVAGIQSDQSIALDCIDSDRCCFVNFYQSDVSYPIVGMSDRMPYASSKFCDLSTGQLDEYKRAFRVKIKEVVTKFRPDVIHCHHLWIVTALARRLFPEIAMVATCHGSDLRQFQNCAHLQADVLAGCGRLDAVMALTQAQKRDIIDRYGLAAAQVHVVGAGYNDALFFMERKPDPKPVQLVYAGKLSRAKGVPWLLRALAQIQTPDWQLHLVGGGSGPEKSECLGLAQQLGKRVVAHGPVSQAGLATIMQQAHIFVLPSFYEGLPLVALEGLASGCRIVTTALPGIQELFQGVNSDLISRVQLPRLRALDQPFQEDQAGFEQRLKSALQAQIRAASQCPQIDLRPIQKQLDAFRWQAIFQNVQSVYLHAVRRKSAGGAA